MSKRKKKKNFFNSVSFLFLVVCVVYFSVCFIKKSNNSIKNISIIEKVFEKDKREEKYYECLNNKVVNENELSLDIQNKKLEIDNFIIQNKYKTSVYYEDILTGFTYTYKPEQVYYGCSLIKLVDALFLIEKATEGSVDLDEEGVVYEVKYKMGYSMGLAKHNYGEKISLRDLIDYAISLSDNSAHLMLIDYIGFKNLKEYGKSLGAKVILTGGDNFGNQTVSDTNIYLKKAYQIITENKDYGDFLKSIMDNNERNDFNTDTIKIYHKYGSYDNNYHDIGLSLEERPYTISIFTLHEYSNHQEVVQNIHKKIRELHNLIYEERKNICKQESQK